MNLRRCLAALECSRFATREELFHGALDGGVIRIEDSAHAALRDDFAYVVFFSHRNSSGSNALHDRLRRRERHVGDFHLQPPQIDGRGADLDFLIRPKPRGLRDGPVVDARAIR